MLARQANICFEAGCTVALVEGAELIADGEPNAVLIDRLQDGLDLDRVIFKISGTWTPDTYKTDEYALKNFLVRIVGSNVNLANVMPEQVFKSESLRAGLRVSGPPP